MRQVRTNSGHTILYSGQTENHINGVAIIINKLTIIQCYAPTNEAEDDAKDNFYEQLQTFLSKVPRHDMVSGDLNAKVGCRTGHGQTRLWREE